MQVWTQQDTDTDTERHRDTDTARHIETQTQKEKYTDMNTIIFLKKV